MSSRRSASPTSAFRPDRTASGTSGSHRRVTTRRSASYWRYATSARTDGSTTITTVTARRVVCTRISTARSRRATAGRPSGSSPPTSTAASRAPRWPPAATTTALATRFGRWGTIPDRSGDSLAWSSGSAALVSTNSSGPPVDDTIGSVNRRLRGVRSPTSRPGTDGRSARRRGRSGPSAPKVPTDR